MRKLNGITINGEYLGNSVVINGMFRAICTISPVIMCDFVHIINKIEELEEAVKINNFNCGFNSIDIEFYNNMSKGIASLYFKLKNGEPELTNYKLIFNNQEYTNINKSIPNNKSQVTNPNKTELVAGETERQKRLRELKEKKLEQQKKLLEQKKQKIEELKKQREEAERLKKMTPEERRNELLKKKREELLKKKQEAAISNANNISDVDNNRSTMTETNETKFDSEYGAANSDNLGIEKASDSRSNLTSQQTNNNKDKTQGTSSISGEHTDLLSDNTEANTGISEANQQAMSSSTINNNEIGDGVVDSAKSATQETDEYGNPIDTSELVTEDYSENKEERSEYDENNDFDENINELNDLNYDDITDEELARLEAELDEELSNNSMDNFTSEEAMIDAELNQLMGATNTSQDVQGMFSNFAKELNDGLSQGLIEGLSQGLSEGLSQGLSQGLGALFGHNGNSGFNPNSTNSNNWNPEYNNNNNYSSGFNPNSTNDNWNSGYNNNNSNGYDFNPNAYNNNPNQQQTTPDYRAIDEQNNNAALSARNSYSYDENANEDDLADYYSDFYSDIAEGMEQQAFSSDMGKSENDKLNSVIDSLQAELDSVNTGDAGLNLMSKDEFLEKQHQLEEAKEKRRRQKFKIVGSRVKVNASALNDGIFVDGKKFYKWGEPKILDF